MCVLVPISPELYQYGVNGKVNCNGFTMASISICNPEMGYKFYNERRDFIKS